MALMEILVRLVCLVTVVNLEKMVYLVLLVLWVKKVLQVVLVLLVCLDTRVHLENKAILDCLVLKDLVEDQDQLALSVQLGNQELEVDVVLQEKLVNLVSLVELVLKVQEEEMAPRFEFLMLLRFTWSWTIFSGPYWKNWISRSTRSSRSCW